MAPSDFVPADPARRAHPVPSRSSRRAGFAELGRKIGQELLSSHGPLEEEPEFVATDASRHDVTENSPTADGARHGRRWRHTRRRTRYCAAAWAKPVQSCIARGAVFAEISLRTGDLRPSTRPRTSSRQRAARPSRSESITASNRRSSPSSRGSIASTVDWMSWSTASLATGLRDSARMAESVVETNEAVSGAATASELGVAETYAPMNYKPYRGRRAERCGMLAHDAPSSAINRR